MQKGWLNNEERKIKGTRIGDVKRNKRELEKTRPPRQAGKVPDQDFRQLREGLSLGGLKDPDEAVEKLPGVREFGERLRAPGGLSHARNFGMNKAGVEASQA